MRWSLLCEPVPCAVVPGCCRTWVSGETAEGLALVQAQYQARNAAGNLTRFTGEAPQIPSAALEWLMAERAK